MGRKKYFLLSKTQTYAAFSPLFTFYVKQPPPPTSDVPIRAKYLR
jgi:hypothetical protein